VREWREKSEAEVFAYAQTSQALSCAVPSYSCCAYMLLRRVASSFSSTTILPSIPHFPPMSHTQPTSTSSNFRLIFDNALESYKKRTKKDLLTHPLAAQLQDCRSPSSILDVLQQQVQELNRSRQRSERLTRWLDPTVKVLHAFSEPLGDVTSVCVTS
jgi:hypothetical protein